MSSFRETHGISDPWKRMEISTMQKTILKISNVRGAGSVNAMMANTMDAAPRSPTKETRAC